MLSARNWEIWPPIYPLSDCFGSDPLELLGLSFPIPGVEELKNDIIFSGFCCIPFTDLEFIFNSPIAIYNGKGFSLISPPTNISFSIRIFFF